MEIEAMVISVGEPQLERCLESVKNQTVPFSRITHTDGIVPNSTAFNETLKKVEGEWVMHIGGDIILYPNAVEIARGYVNLVGNDWIVGYSFGLNDTFLDCTTGFCTVFRVSALRTEQVRDTMFDDRHLPYRLRNKGWRFRKMMKLVVATHFDDPSEFQVFGRFYFHACKFDDTNSYVRTRMNELLGKTMNPLYQVGIDALDFAKIKGVHPGTPNLDFNKKMYVEFNKWRNDERDCKVNQIKS